MTDDAATPATPSPTTDPQPATSAPAPVASATSDLPARQPEQVILNDTPNLLLGNLPERHPERVIESLDNLPQRNPESLTKGLTPSDMKKK